MNCPACRNPNKNRPSHKKDKKGEGRKSQLDFNKTIRAHDIKKK